MSASRLSLWQRPATRSLLLSVNFFLIILAYYQVKPASRSLFLEQAHAVDLPYLWAGSAAVLLALMPLYQRMVRRYSRLNIVIGTCAVTVVLLILFRVLMLWPGLATSVGFFILVDIFSVVLVEQLWSLTNSVCDSAESRRCYGVVASGGLLGGLAGGILAAWLLGATPLASEDLLLVAAGIIVVMAGLTLTFAGRGLYRESTRRVRLASTVAVAEGLRTLRHNRYLALVAVMLLLSQMAEPIVEYQFMYMVEQAYAGTDERTAYLSHFLSLLSGVALLINLFVTPLVHRKLGAIAGLLMQPFLLGLSALGFTFQYWLGMAAGMKIADRGLSYSINRTSRELLYVPVDPVTIYRVKAWIDMVGYRVFKIAGIAAILLLTQWLPWKVSVTHLSWAVVALCGAWMWAAIGIRGDYQTLDDAAALADAESARR